VRVGIGQNHDRDGGLAGGGQPDERRQDSPAVLHSRILEAFEFGGGNREGDSSEGRLVVDGLPDLDEFETSLKN